MQQNYEKIPMQCEGRSRKTWIVKFENGSMVQMFAYNYDDLGQAIEMWGKYFCRDQTENNLNVIEVRRC